MSLATANAVRPILPVSGGYKPRDPRATPIFGVIADHVETLQRVHEERFSQRYGYLPSHLDDRVSEYLECGVFASGFARVRCTQCKHEFCVAFSCKVRYLCTSCHQRKAILWSEWLSEEVCAEVDHRMWVFTIPKRLRWYFRPHLHLLVTDGAIGHDGSCDEVAEHRTET